MSADNQPSRFVFQDPQGRRWPRLRRALLVWLALLGGGLVWFIWSLLVRPELRLPSSVRQLKGQLKTVFERSEPPLEDVKVGESQNLLRSATIQERINRGKNPQAPLPARKARPGGGEVRLGFYVDWDPNAMAALEAHAAALTHLAPEWFSLVETQSRLVYEPDPKLADFAAAHGLPLLPLLTNLSGDAWQPEAVENLALAGVERRQRFLGELIEQLKQSKAAGIILDWEQLDPNYTEEYTALIVQMAEALHHVDLEIWLMVSPGEDFSTFDLEALQLTVDRYVAVLHDENSESDPPGPIASLPWLEGWLEVMSQFGEPGQWIGVLGTYAYDWNTTTHRAETISFRDAMTRASYAGVDLNAKRVIVGPKNYNGLYSYSEPDGDHRVAFLDAISFYNQLRQLRAAKLGGLGIFRLGTGDPAIWEVLEAPAPLRPAAVAALEKLPSDQTITHVGRGEIVSVDDSRDDGRRKVELNADGLLKASYVDFPTFPAVYHQGAGSSHQVAITFDDGPDAQWTPKVLEILRRQKVPACFFLVGKNAEENPGLVRRIMAEGHEIGNHTYSHSNLALLNPLRIRLELNMTQRVLESLTGRSTTLFRPPYNADANPSRIEELIPLKLAQEELGYTIVLERIDPQDWARPGAAEIVQRVKEQRPEGNIVLLHDAGGDRSQTVAALPKIISYLRERGDEIVPISELLSIPRDELMPPVVNGKQSTERLVAGTGFRMLRGFIGIFWAFMIFATAVVVARTLLVAWLAYRHYGAAGDRALAPRQPFADRPAPPLSVIIAAYNESKVIAKTLRSVLDTDYPGELEVIVVDDGSRDQTATEVERLAAGEPRLTLCPQPNRGKARALRTGVARARHELLVFLDADTLFERGTLTALAAPFSDPLVGAVSGNARVGNPGSFIGRCQELEYICGFNLDRRAYTEWNCITVVPGAVSAFRRSAIEAVGGFSHDTLAEDTDLTLSLHRLRYRVKFAPAGVAWTEAPETFATLAKQRFRWAFGTMQCLWKHRDLVFNSAYPALGWFSLPNIWFFQIGLVALTPLVDAILLWSILFGTAGVIWYYFAVFLFLELFLAALACWMEAVPLRRAWWSLPMRLVYRPLLAWVIWRSIFRALKGALVGWGKLERTASVPSRS